MLSSRKKFQPLFLLTLVLLPLTNAKLRGQQQARLEIEDARRFLMGQNPDPTGPAPTDAPTPTDAPDPCARRRGLMEQKETGSEPTDAPVDCLRPTDAPAPTTPAPVPVPTPAPVSVPVPTPAPVDPCARRRFLMGQQTTGPEPTEAPVDCPVDSSSAPTAHESSSPSVESSSAAPSIQASATPSVKAFAAPSDAPVAPTEAPATPAPVAPIEISTPTTASTRIDTPIVFDEANSCNGIFIQWPSFGSNEVTLMASAGFLTLSQTTGLTFTVGDNGGTSSTLAFTATDLPSVQDALDGLTYTPSTAGRQTLSIRMDSEEIASFSIIVNDAMDAAAAIDAITSGVTTIHSAVQPGRLVTYGTTAYPIIMYPGNMDQGPMVGAASYGNGRVVAMPDHQMLSMSSYGETSGIFYDNALQWLTNNGGYDIKIVTYDDVIFDWLIDSAQGYTRVFKISDNSADLITQLQDADVFAGWLGSTEPQANLDALKTFCADRGGGLFIADYGKCMGYTGFCAVHPYLFLSSYELYFFFNY